MILGVLHSVSSIARPLLSLALGGMHQGEMSSSNRKTGRSSVKRISDLSISTIMDLFSTFSLLGCIARHYWQVSCHLRVYAIYIPVLERATDTESRCTRCLLSLAWALREVVELLLIIFVKRIPILTDFAERNINSVNQSIPPPNVIRDFKEVLRKAKCF